MRLPLPSSSHGTKQGPPPPPPLGGDDGSDDGSDDEGSDDDDGLEFNLKEVDVAEAIARSRSGTLIFHTSKKTEIFSRLSGSFQSSSIVAVAPLAIAFALKDGKNERRGIMNELMQKHTLTIHDL